MLTRFHKTLIGLLVVQCGLIVLMLLRSGSAVPTKSHPLLAGFDAAKVTRIQVFGSGNEKIDLQQHGTSWVLASSYDYPVDKSKIDGVLSPIGKMAAADPITTKADRHKQLKVADDDFERKLVLTIGGKDTTIYIGTSAGSRRVAVRIGGDNRVYGVTGVSPWSIGIEPTSWIDTSFVNVPVADITRVEIDHGGTKIELSHPPAPAAAGSGSGSAGSGSAAAAATSTTWTALIDGQPITFAKGETLDTAKITDVVGDLALLDLTGPADPKRDATKPTATITIQRKATGKTASPPIVFDVIADSSSYWAKQRGQDHAVTLAKARLDGAVALDRAALVKAPPAPTKDGKDAKGAKAATGAAKGAAKGAAATPAAAKPAAPAPVTPRTASHPAPAKPAAGSAAHAG